MADTAHPEKPETETAGKLVLTRATPQQWSAVTEWAADEGWNPGLRDVAAFFEQDPGGFFLGHVDGEPATAVSVVNYSDSYAFLGCYLVRPDLRGRGWGMATWNHGLAHAGGRVVGLDGVPAQQDNYRRSGFELAHHTARFTGTVGPWQAPDGTVRSMRPGDIARLHAYDAACLPADRPAFLTTWLSTPGHRTFVRIVDGRLTGYGTVRPARDSFRGGPLFADGAADARRLLSALADAVGGAELAVDVPLSNEPAVRLAESVGLAPSFETARMYTGTVRPHRVSRVFGVTTLELG
ncbi:GNAT family N-acetyltransferase [Streptomyces beihaiensis]|uniref:GNAT family N-acetyltransferase n=1 Tax=Streptomyces beihaiensis TaxID=2984495 RepID=A0ABT3U3A4_9ACTN|nr:GNAT family N-acetyltransferase [Streptomyces beihaiensis]MCX3063783.1 GNAT family N-acetyltransferase [Streptomyces beihaiensis]